MILPESLQLPLKWAEMCALNIFIDLVSLEWHLVQSSEVNSREVPAPGIWLGWGATDGGFCSR